MGMGEAMDYWRDAVTSNVGMEELRERERAARKPRHAFTLGMLIGAALGMVFASAWIFSAGW